MRDFRRLAVWQRAHDVALASYRLTECFPKSEVYGLTSQVRRASTSIPMNIAEGCGTDSEIEFARFLEISMRSASEVEYQLLLSHDLGLVGDDSFQKLSSQVTEIKRMLTSLIRKIRQGRPSTRG